MQCDFGCFKAPLGLLAKRYRAFYNNGQRQTNMKHRFLIIFITTLTISSTFGQSRDSLVKAYDTHAPYKLSSYIFYDFIRQTGVGLDYRVTSKFELDAQFGAFYTHGLASHFVLANDYFDNTGFCVALKTKLFTGRRRHFYIGTYSAIYNYGYNKRWEETDLTNDHQAKRLLDPTELRDKHVNSYTGLGLSMGLKQYFKSKWTMEEFIVIASEQGGQVHEKIYSANFDYHYVNNQVAAFPYDIYYKINRTVYYPVYHGLTFIMNIGIKVGYKIF